MALPIPLEVGLLPPKGAMLRRYSNTEMGDTAGPKNVCSGYPYLRGQVQMTFVTGPDEWLYIPASGINFRATTQDTTASVTPSWVFTGPFSGLFENINMYINSQLVENRREVGLHNVLSKRFGASYRARENYWGFHNTATSSTETFPTTAATDTNIDMTNYGFPEFFKIGENTMLFPPSTHFVITGNLHSDWPLRCCHTAATTNDHTNPAQTTLASMVCEELRVEMAIFVEAIPRSLSSHTLETYYFWIDSHTPIVTAGSMESFNIMIPKNAVLLGLFAQSTAVNTLDATASHKIAADHLRFTDDGSDISTATLNNVRFQIGSTYYPAKEAMISRTSENTSAASQSILATTKNFAEPWKEWMKMIKANFGMGEQFDLASYNIWVNSGPIWIQRIYGEVGDLTPVRVEFKIGTISSVNVYAFAMCRRTYMFQYQNGMNNPATMLNID